MNDWKCEACGNPVGRENLDYAILEEPGYGGSFFICENCYNAKIKPLLKVITD